MAGGDRRVGGTFWSGSSLGARVSKLAMGSRRHSLGCGLWDSVRQIRERPGTNGDTRLRRNNLAAFVYLGAVVKESFASLKDRTLSGAREEYCFRGLSMRLVSLWWELPPWLDSNNRI